MGACRKVSRWPSQRTDWYAAEKNVFWDRAPEAKRALRDWRQLINECAKELTNTKEPVTRELDYTGTLDASGEGAGGVWLSGKWHLKPTVWRVKWPQEIYDHLVTDNNSRRGYYEFGFGNAGRAAGMDSSRSHHLRADGSRRDV